MAPGIREQLEDRITELIFELDLAPGAAMPPEAQLIERLGAGRNSVREALRALHTRGIVDIRHGYGTFVGSAPLATMAPGLLYRTRQSVRTDPGALRDLVAVRRAIESGLITDVVEQADEELFDRLDTEIKAMSDPKEHDTADADRHFHLMLFEPLGNNLATQLIELFWDAFQRVRADLGPDSDPGDIAHWHGDIVTALRARDADAARRAVIDHFDDVESRIAALPRPGDDAPAAD
ncbi:MULTISPECIES: FCD domain-containing protein [unclassified Streptomyces]|uniref:FadR/GntR family transcriptional regulator n=1 Tax=unclassified Streptomyces TaxID=2593676 RepID=UPI002DD9F2D9|nr:MULTISPECIES: FCD domain-containing protein [unclassified Streptomyces]WSA90982.1 FCD domain-containing protein [Streptomyces sp. NBC_01795]WSB75307.1 FCD domain-containing protein [Streptomyces sp. NBC_01775]WSS16410.1 FCD domain-containing protein [Streptomyces sp. NBC_01186]WSS45228.1 FCD domain-containing protein [Streptomyces sp. NBC_01187]